MGISSYGYVSFTNLYTVFNFTDFLPEDDPVVATLAVLTEEFGGGFGETTSILLEGEDLATPEIHNAIIVAINDLASAENVVVFGENVANESVMSSLAAMLSPQDAIPGAPPQAPDMELISGLMSYGVELMSGEGLNALKESLRLSKLKSQPQLVLKVLDSLLKIYIVPLSRLQNLALMLLLQMTALLQIV